jgi:predicted RNA-binding protein with PUA-like domain
MIKKSILHIVIISLFIGACKNADDLFKSYGSESTEIRFVEDFHQLMVGEKFDVILVQDSAKAGTIEMTAGKNVIDGYTCVVKDGELLIQNENKFNWVRKLKVRQKVKVYFKNIDKIQINGAAKITCQDSFYNTDKIEINHGGVEDASFNIIGNYIFLNCSNTGSVDLKGKCFLASVSVDDVSYVNTESLNAEKFYISSFSQESSTVYGRKILDIRLFGNGNIFYKHVPSDILEIEDEGAGNVIKID